MIEISTALNEARLDSVIGFMASGTDNARAYIYDGARPGFGGAPTGKCLVSIVLVEPIGSIENGLLSITPTPEVMIANTGVAAWARIVNGDGALAWDCDVSDLAGSCELRLPSTTLCAGGYTRIVSGLLG